MSRYDASWSDDEVATDKACRSETRRFVADTRLERSIDRLIATQGLSGNPTIPSRQIGSGNMNEGR